MEGATKPASLWPDLQDTPHPAPAPAAGRVSEGAGVAASRASPSLPPWPSPKLPSAVRPASSPNLGSGLASRGGWESLSHRSGSGGGGP